MLLLKILNEINIYIRASLATNRNPELTLGSHQTLHNFLISLLQTIAEVENKLNI